MEYTVAHLAKHSIKRQKLFAFTSSLLSNALSGDQYTSDCSDLVSHLSQPLEMWNASRSSLISDLGAFKHLLRLRIWHKPMSLEEHGISPGISRLHSTNDILERSGGQHTACHNPSPVVVVGGVVIRFVAHSLKATFSTVIPGTPKDMGPPYGKRDPYYSHMITDSYGSGMGIVCVPLTIRGSHVLGSPWKSHWPLLGLILASQLDYQTWKFVTVIMAIVNLPPGPRTPPRNKALLRAY